MKLGAPAGTAPPPRSLEGEIDGDARQRLDRWLRERLPELAPEALPEITRLRGGASNWTYRVAYPAHDLILRRPPAGTKPKSGHDMARESEILSRLAGHYPLAPRALAFCADPAVLGSEFYVMCRLPGLILRRDLPAGMELPPAAARRLCLSFVDALAALHRVEPEATGLDRFARGDGYVERQVAGWSERYRRARTANVPRAERLLAWLTAHSPADAGRCLIHNDFRLDNLVLDADDPTRIVGVLDWEMATVGDPFMDLAGAFAYWVEAGDDPLFRALRRQPSHLPGMLTRAELLAAYCERAGVRQPTAQEGLFYEVFGLFRLAAIAQQIYLRYARRESRDPAFRFFWLYVHYLIWRCHRRMARSA